MSVLRLLPFAALLVASGCVTDYAYHQGTHLGGDYYAGTPRVDYRYHYVDPGIYGYGYYGWYRGGAYPGPYPYGAYPYWGTYGPAYWGAPYWAPYGYGGGYHYRGHRYDGRHYDGRVYDGRAYDPRHGYRTYRPAVDPRFDGSPWRNLDRVQRRDGTTPLPGVNPPPRRWTRSRLRQGDPSKRGSTAGR